MNGRVHDPKIGRFLSPDPIITVGLSPDVNRYAYGWNNPLRVVDPDGLKQNTLTYFEGGSVQFPGITIIGAHDQSALLAFHTFHDATLIGSGLCMIVGGGYSFFQPDGTRDESLQPRPEEVWVTATRLRTSRSNRPIGLAGGWSGAYCCAPMGHDARGQLRRSSGAGTRRRWTSVTMNTVLPRS